MESDEEGTLSRWKARRQQILDPAIAAHRGRIVKTTGDGLLVELASAVDAVRCAVQIQRAMHEWNRNADDSDRIEVRIGVNSGDVIEDEGDLFGDGVNIAARLESLSEPGGICISDRVRDDLAGKIDLALDDCGLQQLKNIKRPIRVHRVSFGEALPMRNAAALRVDMSLPDKPSIAVMPFRNMSEDPVQEPLADGMTEDVIIELSRFRSLFVIAKNSTFTYKGRDVDARRVGRDLGVRYVVEGSVRRLGNRVRLTCQLVDAASGAQLWGERYDRVVEDVFAVQEELTRSLISQIAPSIDHEEQARAARKRPESLSAYEIAVRAWGLWHQAWLRHDPAMREEARKLAREALQIDPRSTRALDSLAMCNWQDLFYRTAADLESTRAEGLALVDRAIAIDRTDHWAHMTKGLLLALSGGQPNWDQALHNAALAVELNPNDSLALHALGWLETIAGEAEKGIQHTRQVLRTNPRDPWLSNVHIVLALASFVTRDYGAGIHFARLASSMPVSHHNCAVCYVGLGDFDSARAEIEMARALAPELLAARLNGVSVWRRPEDRQRHTTFLRVAAGLEPTSAINGLV